MGAKLQRIADLERRVMLLELEIAALRRKEVEKTPWAPQVPLPTTPYTPYWPVQPFPSYPTIICGTGTGRLI